MKIRRAVLLLASFLITAVWAQEFEPIRILGVQVKGNSATSANVIKQTSGLIEGREINPGDFGASVKKLWNTRMFSDIQILLDEETEDGIYIIIEVEENPFLGEVKFQGAKKKKNELEDELNLIRGQRIQPHLLKESIKKIKDLYAKDGYLRAEVEAELSEGHLPNEKDVTFKIEEHRKVKTKAIKFTGNHNFSNRKLRKQLKETKVKKWYLFWRTPFDPKKFEEDKALLTSFYHNHGYKDFRILSDSISYTSNKKGMTILIDLYEGRKYYFRNFTWEGNFLFTDDQLMAKLNIGKGDVYNEEQFNTALYERVQGLYMDDGYIYSQIVPEITPIGEDSLDVRFAIVENNQVFVRKINIAGNTKTRENVIRREFKLMPGDIFNRELLMRSAREIMILNYFANVVPDVIPVDEDEIDLLFTVEEKSSDRATASVGFAGEYGITGGGGFEFNNFLGRGQQLMISFQEGTQYRPYGQGKATKYRSFSFSFVDPMVNDRPVLVGFSAFYYLRGQNRLYYGFPLDRQVVGGSVRLGRRLKWPDNYFRATWMVRGTRKSYKGKQEDLKQYAGGYKETVGLSITQVVARDSRNHPEFPSRGSVMNWSSTLSGGPLGSRWLRIHENFHKHVLKFDWYTPVFWNFALASSLQMGAIKVIHSKSVDRSFVPVDDRFIMGGSGIPYGIMLRGYVDNTVGPYDGGPLGGRVMLKYTSELRVRFSDNPTVYGLLFAEMGNVWKDFSVTDPFDLKRSAGFGIRMFMPMIGMLGFDMGYGFDDVPGTRESPEGWRFHILFGMPF